MQARLVDTQLGGDVGLAEVVEAEYPDHALSGVEVRSERRHVARRYVARGDYVRMAPRRWRSEVDPRLYGGSAARKIPQCGLRLRTGNNETMRSKR